MTNERQPQPVQLQEGYQPKAANNLPKGHQPNGSGALNPQALKPPKGDSAIQPPKPAADK